jgi:hypothetical protein
VKATIILDGSDWVASVQSGTSIRFPRSFYGESAWLEARTWAEHRGARVIEWVPCPLLVEHGFREPCDVCGVSNAKPEL